MRRTCTIAGQSATTRSGVTSSVTSSMRYAMVPASWLACLKGSAPSWPVASIQASAAPGASASTSTESFSQESRPARSSQGQAMRGFTLRLTTTVGAGMAGEEAVMTGDSARPARG